MIKSRRAQRLIALTREMVAGVGRLRFRPPVTHVYNPLTYAFAAYEEYLRRFANGPKRVVFLGMNPGPFGMTQTGVPFGEVAAVRDWLGIRAEIKKPPKQHPKRPILGFDCQRSEVSGRRLWGLFAERFGSPEMFFADHFVANYCPLVFCEESGCNRTPDKLPQPECRRLFAVCDKHLREVAHVLDPEWVIGVGGFAADRARDVLSPLGIRVGQILHPSPASPAANRGWSKIVTAQLVQTGVWS